MSAGACEDLSLLERLVDVAVAAHGELAFDEIEVLLNEAGVLELAGANHDWPGLLAHPKQIVPPGPWFSWGFLTGRGWGKNYAIANFITLEIEAGRAERIALVGPTIDRAVEVMVNGKSGLRAVAPADMKPEWGNGQLTWRRDGEVIAQAFVYSPEVPEALRGPEHNIGWATEISVWDIERAKRTLFLLELGLRMGLYPHMVWDSNASRRHPVLRQLIADAETDPEHRRIVRGPTDENFRNLPPAQLREWHRKYDGTQKGREDLLGEFLDESQGALWQQAWIDSARRMMPGKLRRRIGAVDPATGNSDDRDDSGIMDLGLGEDGQVHVLEDLTTREPATKWGPMVLDHYFAKKWDCVVVELNAGGNLIDGVLDAYGQHRGVSLHVLKPGERAEHRPGRMNLRGIRARGGKDTRAEPVSALYEQGKVSHLIGGDFQALEDELTMWEPKKGKKSPNRMDALVHGVAELKQLGEEKPHDTSADYNPKGLRQMQRIAEQAAQQARTGGERRGLARWSGGGGHRGGL